MTRKEILKLSNLRQAIPDKVYYTEEDDTSYVGQKNGKVKVTTVEYNQRLKDVAYSKLKTEVDQGTNKEFLYKDGVLSEVLIYKDSKKSELVGRKIFEYNNEGVLIKITMNNYVINTKEEKSIIYNDSDNVQLIKTI